MILLLAVLATVALPAQYLSVSPYYGWTGNRFSPGMRVRVQSGDSCRPATPAPTLTGYSLGTNKGFPIPIVRMFNFDGCDWNAVLPADLPLGPMEFVAGNDGGEQASRVAHIVPAAVTMDSDGSLLRGSQLLRPAVPGTSITVEVTGTGNLSAQSFTAHLGSLRFPIEALRRSPRIEGIDEIDVRIPANSQLAGCYIPLRIAVVDFTSDPVMIPVMPESKPCLHPFALTTDQMSILDRGGKLMTARLGFGQSIGGLLGVVSIGGDSAGMTFSMEGSVGIGNLAGPQSVSGFGCFPTYPALIFSPFFGPPTGLTRLELKGPSGQTVPLVSYFGAISPGGLLSAVSPYVSPEGLDPWIVAGRWSLTAYGTNVLSPIEWDFQLPPSVDLHVEDGVWTWSSEGFSPGDAISAMVVRDSGFYSCVADAMAGHFTVKELTRAKLFSRASVVRLQSQPILRPLKLANGQQGIGLVAYSIPVRDAGQNHPSPVPVPAAPAQRGGE